MRENREMVLKNQELQKCLGSIREQNLRPMEISLFDDVQPQKDMEMTFERPNVAGE